MKSEGYSIPWGVYKYGRKKKLSFFVQYFDEGFYWQIALRLAISMPKAYVCARPSFPLSHLLVSLLPSPVQGSLWALARVMMRTSHRETLVRSLNWYEWPRRNVTPFWQFFPRTYWVCIQWTQVKWGQRMQEKPQPVCEKYLDHEFRCTDIVLTTSTTLRMSIFWWPRRCHSSYKVLQLHLIVYLADYPNAFASPNIESKVSRATPPELEWTPPDREKGVRLNAPSTRQ